MIAKHSFPRSLASIPSVFRILRKTYVRKYMLLLGIWGDHAYLPALPFKRPQYIKNVNQMADKKIRNTCH